MRKIREIAVGLAFCAISVAFSGQLAMAQEHRAYSAVSPTAASCSTAEGIAQRLREAKTKGNYGFQNVLAECLADPVGVLHGPTQTPMAKKQILANGAADLEALRHAMADFRNQIDEVSIEGDNVHLAYSWRGTTADGLALVANKRAVLTVDGNGIVALTIYEDPNPESRKIISETFKRWKTRASNAPAEQAK